MKIGRRFGEHVGWKAGPGAIPQTVEVRIVRGMYTPCRACHWYTVCVVPKGNHMSNMRNAEIRNVYQCIDYIARTAQGYENWYRAPYKVRIHQCGT